MNLGGFGRRDYKQTNKSIIFFIFPFEFSSLIKNSKKVSFSYRLCAVYFYSCLPQLPLPNKNE